MRTRSVELSKGLEEKNIHIGPDAPAPPALFPPRKPGILNRPNTLAILILSSLHTLVVFGLPKPPNAREWKLIIAFSYWTFRRTLVAASQPQRSASARARTPIRLR